MLDLILFVLGLGLVLWGLSLGDRAAQLRPEAVSSGCLAELVLVGGGIALMAASVLVAGKMGGL